MIIDPNVKAYWQWAFGIVVRSCWRHLHSLSALDQSPGFLKMWPLGVSADGSTGQVLPPSGGTDWSSQFLASALPSTPAAAGFFQRIEKVFLCLPNKIQRNSNNNKKKKGKEF